jgi:hypothetical protein
MVNYRKIALRMGDGWNCLRIKTNSVSGNSGSATECHYHVPSARQLLQNVPTDEELLNGKNAMLRDTMN